VKDTPKFIVDINVGKLAKWLRMMGYDALLFDGRDDNSMVKTALSEGRIVLTKDSQIMRRRLVATGKLKVIYTPSDTPEEQLKQVVSAANLDYQFRPFSLCLECNQPLLSRSREEVQGWVPPYVFQTQHQYMECPTCHRIYWRGTRWQAMSNRLKELVGTVG